VLPTKPKIHSDDIDRHVSRRAFIAATASAAGVILFAPTFISPQSGSNKTSTLLKADTIDEALEMMSKIGPHFNHGPMAAEALISLGHRERVIPFVEGYKRRFKMDYPVAVGPITAKNWKDALGRKERSTDWITFFNNELKEDTWTRVVHRWADILAPGFSASGAHGILRTSHAVRSLSARKTDLRLRELAEGLGYWAAYYQPLTETRNANIAKLKPEQAIGQVAVIPAKKLRGDSVADQLKSLNDFPPFADSINLIDTDGQADQLLSGITETFANVYVKNAPTANYFSLLHAITATTCVRSLLPYVSAETTRKLLTYGWQTAAGLYSVSVNGRVNNVSDMPEIKKEDLIERAVATNEEHVIKLTEACLREYALNPKQIYLQAANDSLKRFESYP
jgi:hypothetical protein